MKAGKEHRVPLSSRALAILAEAQGARTSDSRYVFPGGKAGKPLSNMAMTEVLRRMGRTDITVHGFRSTFRDWASERANFPSEVVEWRSRMRSVTRSRPHIAAATCLRSVAG